MPAPQQILVVGGGYVGMYTALRLQHKLNRGEALVTVVDPRSYMTYQPFLPETAAGSLEPRHMVVPLRRVLHACKIVSGRVTRIDPDAKVAAIQPGEGPEYDFPYDVLVLCPGSVPRTLPIPGLSEQGIGFTSVAEAIALRNQVLSRLDVASGLDGAAKRKALSFVVVGGGYAGIECLAELENMAATALPLYPKLQRSDLRWVLVEASGRILPEVSESMGEYTVEQLRERGIEVRLNTKLDSVLDGHVKLSDGTEFDTETLIWTAGVKPSPLTSQTGLPLDHKERVKTDATMLVDGRAGHFAAGDSAAVPDLSKDDPHATCSPSAQHAVRQAKVLADNVLAHLRGGELKQYKHAYAGSVASLGLHKGVADIYGVKLKGYPAWFMHRTYHMTRVPTLSRKVRVVADWTLALAFKREVVSLEEIEDPRADFRRALPQPTS